MTELTETGFFGGTLLLSLLALFLVLFVGKYRRRQMEHREEKRILEQKLREAGYESQVEIIEKTLEDLAQEIHDNVCQRLTLANMYLRQAKAEEPPLREESIELIEQAIFDLRNLSKVLSGNYVLEHGILLALEKEVQRLGMVNGLSVDFTINGEHHLLEASAEVIVFRCAQEVISNVIKHAKASKLKIHWASEMKALDLRICDNGCGFRLSDAEGKGLGISNIRKRIALLGGICTFQSEAGNTCVSIHIPYQAASKSS